MPNRAHADRSRILGIRLDQADALKMSVGWVDTIVFIKKVLPLDKLTITHISMGANHAFQETAIYRKFPHTAPLKAAT